MPATRIDPNTMLPSAEDGSATNVPETVEALIACVNEHADELDEGGDGDGISVMAYGAVGDGVTDDSDAISNAKDAAISSGKRLHFPQGEYFIGGEISYDGTGTVAITGRNATILYSSTVRRAFVFSAASDRVSVTGMAFQGENNDDTDVNSYAAIYVDQQSFDVLVDSCRFEQCTPVTYSGNYMQPGRFVFSRNTVKNAPNAVSTPQQAIVVGNFFVNDAVVATRSHAVYVFGSANGCVIANNVFKNIATEDIQIRAGATRYDQKFGFVISGNYFENSAQYSIWVGSDTTINAGGYTITGNTFKNCYSPIQAQGLSNSVIANNMMFWDWEYQGARGSGHGIAITSGGTIAQRYGMPKGLVVEGNNIVHRHPYFGVVTLNSVPSDGDTLTVGSNTYTWKNTPSTTGHIQIAAGDIPDCLGNLQNALLGTNADIYNDINAVVRDASDVFYNAFAGSGDVTNKLVIVSRTTFTLSRVGASMTLTAPIDNRDACTTGISVDKTLHAVVRNNHLVDHPVSIEVTYSHRPIIEGNTCQGGAAIIGTGNALSVYRGNRFTDIDQLNTSAFRLYRLLQVRDGFPLFQDNGIVSEQEYTTRELLGAAGRVSVGDGKARCFMWYGLEQYGDGDTNTIPFSWRDGDTVQFRGTGKANLDLTFKRTAPGAGQFNDVASFIAAVNASADWDAAYGSYVNVGGTTQPPIVELKVAAAGAIADARVYVTTLSKTCGVVLRNDYDGIAYAQFLGGAATLTKTAIFSPIASDQVPAVVQGVDATSHALAPVAYLADCIPGVGYVITHTAAAGTEEFVFRITSQ